MAKATGSASKVTLINSTAGETIYYVRSWTCDWVGDMLDDTDTADSGNKSAIVGLRGATGSFEWHWDGSTAPLIPGSSTDTAEIQLYLTGTIHISLTTALINTVSFSPMVDGIITITYSFTSTGAVSYQTV